MDGILGLLLQRGDSVAAVRFEPVDGMPWVKATKPSELLRVAGEHGIDDPHLHDGGDDIKGTLTWAAEEAEGRPIVIAGSLYLVSSVLRLLRALKTRK